MTLPASPPITAQDINVELGRSATAPFSIDGAEERALAGVPSGAISFSDFLGKSNVLSLTDLNSFTMNGATTNPSTSVDIGAEHANKTVFVVVHWFGTATTANLNSGTVDGTGTNVRGSEVITDGSSKSVGIGIMEAEVSTAGTVTIAATMSNTITGAVFDVYSTTQDWSLVQYLDTSGETAASPLEISVNIDISAGGAVMAGSTTSQPDDNITWTGATETDERNIAVADGRSGGAMSQNMSVEANRLVRASQTHTGTDGIAIAAMSIVKA